MKPALLPATRWDIHHLAAVMRPSDIDECSIMARVSGRWTPKWTILSDLLHVFDHETVYSMWLDDMLVGCGGVASMSQEGRGAVWFLGTDKADECPISFTQGAKMFVDAERGKWVWMGNVVPKHFAKRLKWLRKLGFDTNEEEAQRLDYGVVTFWTHA